MWFLNLIQFSQCVDSVT